MKELSEIRGEIDLLDGQLKPLLSARMDLAAEVAASKAQSAKASGESPTIFIKKREDEILAAVDAGAHTKAVAFLMREIMGVSRKHQYTLLYQSGAFAPFVYTSGQTVILPLADTASLTDALSIVCRYEVTVHVADAQRLVLSTENVTAMQTLYTQLSREGFLKA